MTLSNDFADARRLPLRERRAEFQRLAGAADAVGDLDLAYNIRMSLVSDLHNSPDGLLLIATYGWLLARHDEDPERFPFGFGLWYFKWIFDHAPCTPDVTLAQINDLLDDFERRIEAAGSGRAIPVKSRMHVAEMTGQMGELEARLDEWRGLARGGRFNDCRACDIASEASALAVLGRHDEAVEVAQPLLDEEQRCATQPHYLFASMLEAGRSLDHPETARWHERGLELIDGDPDFLSPMGHHIRHATLVGDLDRAIALAESTTAWTQQEAEPLARHQWDRGVRLAVAAGRQLATIDTGRLDRLATLLGSGPSATATRFDDRNGNEWFTVRLERDDAELAARLGR